MKLAEKMNVLNTDVDMSRICGKCVNFTVPFQNETQCVLN